MAEPQSASAMAARSPKSDGGERLLARHDVFAAIAERIGEAKPRIVVFCGRGSSGHAGVYLRYLFEVRLALLASASAPSVVTAYQRPPDMRGALFVVISQSGRSPDIVTATQVARESGALTLAIVNDENSPQPPHPNWSADRRGIEQSVAATKSVVLSMIAGARLVAGLAATKISTAAQLYAGPPFCRAYVRLVGLGRQCSGAPAAFVVGRGYGLGCAREIALKVSEILQFRLSVTAPLSCGTDHAHRSRKQHPSGAATERPAAAAVDELVRDLGDAGVFTAGGRRERCLGSATVTRFAIRFSCWCRRIVPSNSLRAGAASIRTTHRT